MTAQFFWRSCKAGVAASLLALLTACTTLPAPDASNVTNKTPTAPVAPLASAASVVAPPASVAPLALAGLLKVEPVFSAPALAAPLASAELPTAPPVVPLTAPASPLASAQLPTAEHAVALPVPASPLASTASRASRFSEFISRHLLRRAENPAPVPVAEAVPVPETPVDEKYRLTGEDALEVERGKASWYGGQFHGRRTASGENYDKYALTAAHKTLPFGTIVRVRSLKLGREVDVRINDRGPFAPGRVIDVSQAAAEALGLVGAGVAEVSLNMAGPQGLKMRKALRKPHKAPSARRRR
ncbi:rare lipoprotein A (peptidoglycan hydrolase) [Polaromonas sp. CG_9.5]|nr:rare lipoprotein A (peptidoglycan hydrolase) [Polaromonas sp. CG_9.5]